MLHISAIIGFRSLAKPSTGYLYSPDYGTMNQPGRKWVINSLVCAGLALAVTPVVFGPLSVVAGFVAAWKGARWWATLAVTASFVAAVVSAYLAAWLAV